LDFSLEALEDLSSVVIIFITMIVEALDNFMTASFVKEWVIG